MKGFGVMLEKLTEISEKASKVILPLYRQTLDITQKGDGSPITEADFLSHKIICEELYKHFPNIPIVSEEDPKHNHQKHKHFFLVDPLDGTKEFIEGCDEFCICIGLIEENYPKLGVITAPAKNDIYYGGLDYGAYKNGKEIHVSLPQNPPRTMYSRNDLLGLGNQCIPMGSALKFCMIAEGLADKYPRSAPLKEWDTCAGHAILEGAGGRVLGSDGKGLKYNNQDLTHKYGFRADNVRSVIHIN